MEKLDPKTEPAPLSGTGKARRAEPADGEEAAAVAPVAEKINEPPHPELNWRDVRFHG
jgi:hypothetical protein